MIEFKRYLTKIDYATIFGNIIRVSDSFDKDMKNSR